MNFRRLLVLVAAVAVVCVKARPIGGQVMKFDDPPVINWHGSVPSVVPEPPTKDPQAKVFHPILPSSCQGGDVLLGNNTCVGLGLGKLPDQATCEQTCRNRRSGRQSGVTIAKTSAEVQRIRAQEKKEIDVCVAACMSAEPRLGGQWQVPVIMPALNDNRTSVPTESFIPHHFVCGELVPQGSPVYEQCDKNACVKRCNDQELSFKRACLDSCR